MRMILNPRWVHSSIFLRQKAVDSGDRVEEWGTFLMAWRMVVRDHYVPISTGKSLAAQFLSRVVAGWLADQGGAATVGCCTDLRYVRRLTACVIFVLKWMWPAPLVDLQQ